MKLKDDGSKSLLTVSFPFFVVYLSLGLTVNTYPKKA